jgi:hypothetical protein
MYCYSLQIKMGFKNKKQKIVNMTVARIQARIHVSSVTKTGRLSKNYKVLHPVARNIK